MNNKHAAKNSKTTESDTESSEVIEISDDASSGSDHADAIEWYEESSESDPELECDVWDDDCVTIQKSNRQNAITGFHLMPTCLPEHELPPMKKQKLNDKPTLNEALLEQSFIDAFKENWLLDKDYTANTTELTTHPFRFCIVDDLVSDKKILNEVRQEFNDIELRKRSMDLYEFFQSEDLIKIKEKHIKEMYEFIKTDVKDWLEKLTGLKYHDISATCSIYSDTDFLLIHDDLERDRAIAFVFYLTDPKVDSDEELWTKEMGGLLEIFSNDDKGHPECAAKQITPKNNRFIFFKVSNKSYHQVSEVLNMDHSRLSINGWFHTRNPEKFETPILEQPKTGIFGYETLPPLMIEFPLENWISRQYLQPNTQKQIQQHIENDSEICLNNFFENDMYTAICEVLRNDDIIWDMVGPPNRRKYEVISTKVLPNIINEMLTMFQSKSMFNLLQDFTDLDLSMDMNADIHPTLRFELQRWKPGYYSIFSEFVLRNENQLDLIMYLGNPNEFRIVGGQTMYISTTEAIEDALVTLQPKPNSLNIVFHDTPRIVKFVSNRSYDKYFYLLVCSYKE